MTPEKLRALAANLEDVLLRWHGDPDDAETIRQVADDLLLDGTDFIDVTYQVTLTVSRDEGIPSTREIARMLYLGTPQITTEDAILVTRGDRPD